MIGKLLTALVDITRGGLEETLKALRQAKAKITFNAMRARAAEKGYMSDGEIAAEIDAARMEQ